MPDQIFGLDLPEYEPDGVFPFNPDFGFKKRRIWKTITHRFSPALAQCFIQASVPQIEFSIGLSTMKGTFDDAFGQFQRLWLFFNNHRGRQTSFWFYDPRAWATFPAYDGTYPYDYRDDPGARPDITPVEIEGVLYNKYRGRHVCVFSEDEMTAELFEYRLRKTDLKVIGYEAFTDA